MTGNQLPGEIQQEDHWPPNISQQREQQHNQIQQQLQLASIHDPITIIHEEIHIILCK